MTVTNIFSKTAFSISSKVGVLIPGVMKPI
jgi:hypothetical protein